MITEDIRKHIKHIEIQTKRLLSGSLVGDSRSAVKGSGYEFDQIREYQMGDDVRFIDWKSSARMSKLLVKQYIEERNRTIILAIDISASSLFTSSGVRKLDIFQQVAAVLAVVAGFGRDNISLILFSDEIELFIPPGRGKSHIHSLVEQIFTCTPRNKKTNVSVALNRLAKLKRKDAVVFLISDFIDDQNDSLLAVVSRMYDLIAVRTLDKYESDMPAVGLLPIEDIETGQEYVLDTRGRTRKKINAFLSDRIEQQNRLFKKYRIDYLELFDHKTLISDTIRFFRRRMVY